MKNQKNNSINKLIDYEIYFNNVINRSQKEELSRQISTFEQKNQISFEEREIARIRSQNNLKEETKRVDFNKENRKNIESYRIFNCGY